MARIINTTSDELEIPTPDGSIFCPPGEPVDVPDEYAHGRPAVRDDHGRLVDAGRSGLLDQDGWELAPTTAKPSGKADTGGDVAGDREE